MFAPALMKRGPGYQLWSLAVRPVSSSAALGNTAASPPPPGPPVPPVPPALPPHLMEVFVNDQSVTVPKGISVLQACDAAGVDIPR